MGLFRRKKEARQHEGQEGRTSIGASRSRDLQGWSPVITAKVVVTYFFVVAAVCVALGVPVLVASLGIVQYSVRYDDQGPMAGLGNQARAGLRLGRSVHSCT